MKNDDEIMTLDDDTEVFSLDDDSSQNIEENIEKLKDMYTLDLIVKQDKNIKPGKLEIKVLEKYPEFLEDYK